MDVDYNTGNIDLISFKQTVADLQLDLAELSDDADGAAILPPGTDQKPRPSKREPLRRMNSGGRLRNVRKAWGDFKSKMKIPKKGTKNTKWNVPQCSPENRTSVMRTPKSVTKQRLLDIAYSPDFFRTPEQCRIYRDSNKTTPDSAQGEFLRRSIRIANRTPTPTSMNSQKTRKRSVKPRRIENNSSQDVYQEVNNLVQMTRTLSTLSSAVDGFKGMASGLEESIEKSESKQDASKVDSKKANGNKKQKTPSPK
ncbi:uncharacterized protein LOC117118364 [Anneissia japonica]|uniref:uncharacterized protein LOC117118364 n=1 Tax=Anneissia japonica TaxID=1529436 RepID=UPI0014258F50|nr:uncharacterized protein LOC117118364 [Anneissia japonica]